MARPKVITNFEFFSCKIWRKRVTGEPDEVKFGVVIGTLNKEYRDLLNNSFLSRDEKSIELCQEFLLGHDKMHIFDEIGIGKRKFSKPKMISIETHFGFPHQPPPFDKLAQEVPEFLLILTTSLTRGFYLYQGSIYLAVEESDILGLEKEEPQKRERDRIPDDTQIFVWKRDGGACVKCSSSENLAYDHIIPFSKGGSNSRRNLQLLCDTCNLNKGNKIGG